MPNYEYRQLTPLEREQVVELRREHGYPLHAPPHPFRQPAHYFITAINYEHKHIMHSPARRTEFETRLMNELEKIHADVSGWVILPNHYHMLIGVASLDFVSAMLFQLHGTTSREWNAADNLTSKRRVWYKFRDRMIRDEIHFYTALNYIHINPVKHGYVSNPYDWCWSSVHNYVDAHGKEWLREKWKAYPPGEMGKDWDDD